VTQGRTLQQGEKISTKRRKRRKGTSSGLGGDNVAIRNSSEREGKTKIRGIFGKSKEGRPRKEMQGVLVPAGGMTKTMRG